MRLRLLLCLADAVSDTKVWGLRRRKDQAWTWFVVATSCVAVIITRAIIGGQRAHAEAQIVVRVVLITLNSIGRAGFCSLVGLIR
jgi:hypothetical protein